MKFHVSLHYHCPSDRFSFTFLLEQIYWKISYLLFENELIFHLFLLDINSSLTVLFFQDIKMLFSCLLASLVFAEKLGCGLSHCFSNVMYLFSLVAFKIFFIYFWYSIIWFWLLSMVFFVYPVWGLLKFLILKGLFFFQIWEVFFSFSGNLMIWMLKCLTGLWDSVHLKFFFLSVPQNK